MNFSEFLNILFKNATEENTNKKFFVIDLFESTKIKFLGGPDKATKLSSEGPTRRPIDSVLQSDYKGKYKIEDVQGFLSKNLNKIRIYDLISSFSIPEDEKKDFNILVEAIAIQFDNYINFGEEKISTSVCSIYLNLLDQYGNGSNPNANSEAIFAAKQTFYSAVKNIADLNPNDEVLNIKGPIENFFKGVSDTFRAFESKCNREGKTLFRKVKSDVIKLELPNFKPDESTNEYLELITEPGALPIELIKQLKYVIYDNITFEDKITELTIKLLDDFSRTTIIDAFEKLEFYKTNEIFFTEYIMFHLNENSGNLLNNILYIITKIDIILNYLEDTFDKHPKMIKLNEKFDDVYKKLSYNRIRYMSDGTYFPETKKLEYAMSMEPFLHNKDGSIMLPGDTKITLNQMPLFTKLPEDNLLRFKTLFLWNLYMLREQKQKDMMIEFITLNEDNTCRHFLYPPTCKAKTYRKIREYSDLVFKDGIIGFMTIAISVINNNDPEIAKLTSDERMKLGVEHLTGFAYIEDKCYEIVASLDAKLESVKLEECQHLPHIYNPLMKKIIIYKLYKKYQNEELQNKKENE